MEWIGQHIYDLASRFRNDVYLEDVSTSTETDMLVVDSAGKITKRAIDAITVDVSDFMTNGVNNRVLTATGTDAMNAEANLTFDGETLGLIGGTTTNIIDINARTLTTGSAIYIDCDSLGNSPTIHLDVDDAQTTTASRILHWIDYDKSSNTPNTIANSVTGSAVHLNDNGTSNHAGSTHILTGHDSQIKVSNANGTHVISGHRSTITNGTAFPIPGGVQSYFSGITDGFGVDFKSISSANTADYFSIETTTNGATTLTTVDADAALAHFEIAADGNITLDAAGDIALEANTTVTGDFTVNGDNITFESANADDPNVIIKNTTDDNQAARLTFTKDRGAAMGDNDRVAEIDFIGEDASQNTQGYGKIMCQALESDHGVETGAVKIQVAEYDGTLTNGLYLSGGNADGVVNITLGAGAASTTTVAGTLTMGSTAAMTNAGLLSVANQTGITGVGTISSGVWQGTAVASAYLDADTAHYSATKQFTYHMFKDDIDTTKHYIGLQEADAEAPSAPAKNLPFTAGVAGKLLKVFLRSTGDLSGQTLTWRLETVPTSSDTGSAPTVIGTQSGAGCTDQTMTTYDFTTSLDSGDNIIDAGDQVLLSIQSSASTALLTYYVTCLWEWDLG